MQNELNKIGKVFTTDILIIGAGLGGTVTATKVHELNESAKILLIEKGIMDIPEIPQKRATEWL